MRGKAGFAVAAVFALLVAPAAAATSDWMDASRVQAHFRQIAAQGHYPTSVECKAGEGFSRSQFTKVRVVSAPNTKNIDAQFKVLTLNNAQASRANMERAARAGLDVKTTGYRIRFASFSRFQAPRSRENLVCVLEHHEPQR